MNEIGQQAKAYVSPIPKTVMTVQTNVNKVPETGFRKYMYVKYMICKAVNKAYKL